MVKWIDGKGKILCGRGFALVCGLAESKAQNLGIRLQIGWWRPPHTFSHTQLHYSIKNIQMNNGHKHRLGSHKNTVSPFGDFELDLESHCPFWFNFVSCVH